MECIQRTQLDTPELACPVDEWVVEADEADRAKQAAGSADEVVVPGASQGMVSTR